MPFHEAAHDGQADTKAALRPIEDLPFLNEEVRYVRQNVRRDAHTGVADAQKDFIHDGRERGDIGMKSPSGH